MFPVGMTWLDNNGNPLAGGKIYTYTTGTNTPKATYTSATGGTTLPNPVVLDAYGRASYNDASTAIWGAIDTDYRIIVKTSADVQIVSMDNVSGILSPLYEAWQSENIKFANNKGLLDDSGNEQLLFGKTASAVNYIKITNSATGNAVAISSEGSDSNIGITISCAGTGTITLADAVSCSSTLAVTGTSTLTGNTTVGGTLGVTGAATFQNVVINGTLTGGGSIPTAATQAEIEATSSTTTYVSPGRLVYSPYAAKVWVFIEFSGGTPVATVAAGVSSLTDSGSGVTTVNFTNSFSSVNYAVLITRMDNSQLAYVPYSGTRAVGSCRVTTINDAGSATDLTCAVAIYGDI
jgi:hypothetical protein